MNLIKTKYLLGLCISLLLPSCRNSPDQHSSGSYLYFTDNTGSLYCFDLNTNTLHWENRVKDTAIDELTYFSIDSNNIIKAYLDGHLRSFDKTSGKINWTFMDKVSEDQAYYNYDFSEVRYAMFYQYPAIFKNNMVYANSHGEIKSVDRNTRKTNWVYQVNVMLCSPIVIGDKVYVNTGYNLVCLDAATGKKTATAEIDEGSANTPVYDKGHIYVLSEYGTVYCFNEALEKQWTYKSEQEDMDGGDNLIINDRHIIFGSNMLVCINKENGKPQWEKDLRKEQLFVTDTVTDDGSTSYHSEAGILSLSATPDGYVFNTQKYIVLMDDKGNIQQKKHLDNTLYGSIFYCNNSYFVTSRQGQLICLSKDLGRQQILKEQLPVLDDRGLANTYYRAE